MKIQLTLVFLLLFSFSYSQDFFRKAKIDSSNWTYRSDSAFQSHDAVQGFFLDSIQRSKNSNSYFFSKRLIKRNYSNLDLIPWDPQPFRSSANIFGKQLIEDSLFWKFIGFRGDTTTIPKHLNIGDSIICYQDSLNKIWVKRYTTDSITEYILNPKSLKVKYQFVITGDSVPKKLKALIQNQNFHIHKKLGFWKIPDMYLFPRLQIDSLINVASFNLIGSSLNNWGKFVFNKSRIYDYRVGDTFGKSITEYYSNDEQDRCNILKFYSVLERNYQEDSYRQFRYQIKEEKNCQWEEYGENWNIILKTTQEFNEYFDTSEFNTSIFPSNPSNTFDENNNTLTFCDFESWNSRMTFSENNFEYFGPLDSLHQLVYYSKVNRTTFSSNTYGDGIGRTFHSFSVPNSYYSGYDIRRYEMLLYFYSPSRGLSYGEPPFKNPKPQTIIFPNPTTGILNISNIENLQSIRVLNLQGKVVLGFNKPQNQIDLSELPNGIYFVQNITSNGIETHKVILRK